MVISPQVSWLFFKARAKCPYLDPYGPSEQRGKWAGGCVARRLRIELDMSRSSRLAGGPF